MRPAGVIWYGGDWNPEQWPEPVWGQDVALMREAGVNLVTVGVFAWSRLEPAPGRYTFDWLDRALDLAHTHGIRVDLATPTASPPPWFSLAHPDALPVTAEGVRLSHGSRDTYCAAAPAYRAAARRIATALAGRYGGHPALAMWHVHNEYGTICYCEHAAAGFRRWLRERYPDLAGLNDAWGTSFWSQHYTDWAQVLPPRATQYLPNPHQALDFRRFWSDELLAAFREQRDLLRAATPAVPVTTNFAVGPWVPVDHRRWAAEVDLVALDAYPDRDGAASQTAFLADLARHWAGPGPHCRAPRPWLLMEQSPGTLAQRGTHTARPPGELARLSATHLARGATGVLHFQWRASAAGAEQFHAGMVPHAGPDSRIFAEVRELGAVLARLGAEPGLATATVRAEVAIAWDAESWWALRAPHLPSDQLDYLAALRRAHEALWSRQVTADFVDLASGSGTLGSGTPGSGTPGSGTPGSGTPGSGAPGLSAGESTADGLAAYRLVLVPSLYLADAAVADAVRRYVAAGGHLVVWYLSGIADRSGRVWLGGYPGAFREVLGVRVEEFCPLPPGETIRLSDGSPAVRWSERVRPEGAEVVLRYAAGALSGGAAVTRHRYGAGTAWYVSTELAAPAYQRLLDGALAGAGSGVAAGSVPGGGLPAGVELVTRERDGVSWRFVMNHAAAPVELPLRGVELVSGAVVAERLRVPAGGFAVVRSDPPSGIHRPVRTAPAKTI